MDPEPVVPTAAVGDCRCARICGGVLQLKASAFDAGLQDPMDYDKDLNKVSGICWPLQRPGVPICG